MSATVTDDATTYEVGWHPSRCKNCGAEAGDGHVRIVGDWMRYQDVGRKIRPHWAGLCRRCAREAENARQRDLRLGQRANRTCEVCGDTFTPPRADGRYCSPACRQRAYRQRAYRQRSKETTP